MNIPCVIERRCDGVFVATPILSKLTREEERTVEETLRSLGLTWPLTAEQIINPPVLHVEPRRCHVRS